MELKRRDARAIMVRPCRLISIGIIFRPSIRPHGPAIMLRCSRQSRDSGVPNVQEAKDEISPSPRLIHGRGRLKRFIRPTDLSPIALGDEPVTSSNVRRGSDKEKRSYECIFLCRPAEINTLNARRLPDAVAMVTAGPAHRDRSFANCRRSLDRSS